jgi:hypothetical protein
MSELLSREDSNMAANSVCHAQSMQTENHRAAMWEGVSRPAIAMKPRLFIDGNMWCCLYGEDLQNGVAGFGKTPAAAMAEFERALDTPLPEKDKP